MLDIAYLSEYGEYNIQCNVIGPGRHRYNRKLLLFVSRRQTEAVTQSILHLR
jgi:hypothetical protein